MYLVLNQYKDNQDTYEFARTEDLEEAKKEARHLQQDNIREKANAVVIISDQEEFESGNYNPVEF